MSKTSRRLCALVISIVAALAVASPASAGVSPDLDTTFGQGGSVTAQFPGRSDAVAVEMVGGGRILVAGAIRTNGRRIAVTRYLQDGHPDVAFGDNGKVVHSFPGGGIDPSALLVLPSGKFVIGGTFDPTGAGRPAFALARFERNGSLDDSFGDGGRVVADLGPGVWFLDALVRQADGRIVAAGARERRPGLTARDFAVARFQPNGSLDTGYGDGGRVVTSFDVGPDNPGFSSAEGLALDVSGRVIAVGTTNSPSCDGKWAIARYLPTGDLDPTFGGDGKVVTGFVQNNAGAEAVEVADDDTINVAGWTQHVACSPGAGEPTGKAAVARYLPNGHLDRSFGGDGKVVTGFSAKESEARFNAMTLEEGGQIAAAGVLIVHDGLDQVIVGEYLRTGELNPAFSDDGRATAAGPLGNAAGAALFEDPDGRPVVAGRTYNDTTSRFLVERFKASGAG